MWFGPMKAAGRWGELGADAREIAQLRYGVNDQPDREAAPFRLPGIRLSVSESVEMEAIIEKRLNGQIWRDLSLEQGRREQYVSREFMVQNTDVTMRGVADLSHLSDHYDSIATNAETLEGFSASLMPRDRILSIDLCSGYNHFRLHPDMQKYFTVRIVMADSTERYFQYLVLPLGWSRSGYWFSRLVQRFWTMVKRTLGYHVLSYVDEYAIAPSLGRPASLADCRRASRRLDALLLRYGLTRHPSKGV
jgi:hypothetical protein